VCGYTPPVVNGYPALAYELSRDDAGFNPRNFEKLARLEAEHFWFRARNRLIIWALKRYFPDARNFLEIGCGTGFVLSGIEQTAPGLRLWGSELSCEGLAFAGKRVEAAELFQMDARRIPFVREFDVIGAFDVLEHVEEDMLVLREMGRAVKVHGGILLTVPNHKFLWSRADEDAHHVRRYTMKELKCTVENAGFSIMRMTAFISFLFPLMMAARLKRGGANADVMAELEMPRLLNRTFEKVLDAERQIIRAGVNFPFGGSLLLVAQKV